MHMLYCSEILKTSSLKIEAFGNSLIFLLPLFVFESKYILHSGILVSEILEAVFKKGDHCCVDYLLSCTYANYLSLNTCHYNEWTKTIINMYIQATHPHSTCFLYKTTANKKKHFNVQCKSCFNMVEILFI